MHVRHTCYVTVAIRNNYRDTTWCDIVLMDTGDISLRPWPRRYDKNGIHAMCETTFTFVYNGKIVTLLHLKPDAPKKGLRPGDTKELFQVCQIYKGNANRTQV